jgi:hypothetical protein
VLARTTQPPLGACSEQRCDSRWSDEVANPKEVGWTPVAHPKLVRIDTLEYREQGRPVRGSRHSASTQGEVVRPTNAPASLGGDEGHESIGRVTVVTHGGV